MKFGHYAVVAVALAGLALPPLATAAPAETPDRAKTLIVGRITRDVDKQLSPMESFAKALARRLADVGIVGAGAEVATDNTTMETLLRAGRIDVFSDTLFATV